MHLRRFFVDEEINIRDTVSIQDEERHHIVKVLRLKVGDEVDIFNGRGKEFKATIKSIQQREIFCVINEEIKTDTEAKLRVFLAFGVVKSDKTDLIIQKCTELGVHSLIPFQSEYTVVDYREKNWDRKIDRWKKIAIGACKQSLRTVIPKIIYQSDFNSCVEYLKEKDLKLILNESEKKIKLKEILDDYNDPQSVVMIIGPEGGFSDKEINYAIENGFKSVSLGKRILRAESAIITALSIVMYQYNEL